MSRHRAFSAFQQAMSLLGDAATAASAARRGHQPPADALRRLGIDPEGFSRIRRF